GLILTLRDGNATDDTTNAEMGITNVVGTAGGDTILGNAQGNQLLGAAFQDDRAGTSTWNGREQIVLLDFTSYNDTIAGNAIAQESYTPAERTAILNGIAADYAAFNAAFSGGGKQAFYFTLSQSDAITESIRTGGGGVQNVDYATLYFNRTPSNGQP